MTRDGFTRMDVDTRWPHHRKARKLRRLHPADWPSYQVAWFALLGEAWWSKDRLVTLDDAWVPGLPVDLEPTQAALTEVGYLDAAGHIAEESWEEWFGPALARITAASERGAAAAQARWHGPQAMHTDASALPEQSNGHTPRQPASQPATPTTSLSTRSLSSENARGIEHGERVQRRPMTRIGGNG